ncbi:hypothetical protein TL16_g00806 [Triparma laevis f. inornata]|uniref:Uncharacterized protein n=1 Tax=Triparma laevis f. inornata TaxID=1714386 RepID=A0A9W7DQF6_9STRA|nr:hypothetical protein TL16_g00806 [Triparma laevis f. inornata]
MMIPDSLQTLGFFAFRNCSKLVPSDIIVRDNAIDTTSEVVAHLRSQTSLNALLSGNNFVNTDDFRRLIVPYLQCDTLMAIRLASKPWSRVVDEFIGDGVESSAMIVNGGEDSQGIFEDFKERRKLITRVVFLLNITHIGENACFFAANLIVVDIPEGVESIGGRAFFRCDGLTTMFFPTTLKHIGEQAFTGCYSLENVDLLDTNLREIGYQAFEACSELKSMMIPDYSLQTLGRHVFHRCSKLVPSNIEVDFEYNDTTSEVIAHLRSLQSPTT